MKITAIALFSIFAFVTIRPTNAQVRGTLIDERGNFIVQQNLYLDNGVQTRTDLTGIFEFNQLLPGSYSLMVQIKEQLVYLSSFEVKPGETVNLGNITLNKTIQLKEAKITDTYIQRHIERMPEIRDNVIYSGKKNEVVKLSTATANLAQNNSRQVFAKVPGVQVWESDGSGVQMGIATRGLSPNRMWEFNTRQNGYDIASDPFGYPEAYFTPSVESLDRIEVIRGAASLQYGPQFGGMINYIKKQSISNKRFGLESVQTTGSNGLFSTFNAVGGDFGKFSYYGNVNYRKSDGWRTNNDYETVNGYLHLGYRISKKIKVSFEYSRMHQLVHQPGGLTDSLFRIDPKISLRERNWFNLDWHIPAFTLEYQIRENQQLTAKVFGLAGFRTSIGNLNPVTLKDLPDSNGIYSLRRLDGDVYKNVGAEIRYLIGYNLGKKKHHLATGVRLYQGQTNRFRNTNGNRGTQYTTEVESDVRVLDQRFGTQNLAFFAENLFHINSRISITPGFRFEHLENTSEGKASATLTNSLLRSNRNFVLLGVGSEYKLNGAIQIYGNVSQGYRPVLFSDLTPASTNDSIDQNLTDSKGLNADLGIRGSIGRILNFDVSTYYLYYGDRIGTYAIGPRNYRTNIGASESKGVEIYIEFTPTSLIPEWKGGNLNLFISSSFMDSRYTQWKNPDPAKNQQGKQVENAPNQIHRLGITYQYQLLSTTFQFGYNGGTYSDALNTKPANDNGQVGFIPSYQIADWSFQLRLPYRLQLNGGINNLFNAYYFTRRGGGYPGPGLLPAEGRTWYVGLGIKL